MAEADAPIRTKTERYFSYNYTKKKAPVARRLVHLPTYRYTFVSGCVAPISRRLGPGIGLAVLAANGAVPAAAAP